jgi:hypothetical protein
MGDRSHDQQKTHNIAPNASNIANTTPPSVQNKHRKHQQTHSILHKTSQKPSKNRFLKGLGLLEKTKKHTKVSKQKEPKK